MLQRRHADCATPSRPGARLMAALDAAPDAQDPTTSVETPAFGFTAGAMNLAATFIVILLVVGVTNYSFGLFVKPVAAEFHLSRATMNLGLIALQLGSAILSPAVGWLADTMSPRRLFQLSGVLVGGGVALLGVTSSLPVMVLTMGLPIAFGVSVGTLTGAVLASRSFPARRGRALMIAGLGTSGGGLIAFPILAALLAQFGWREALVIAGIGIVGIASLLSLIVTTPPIAPAPAATPTAALADDRAWRLAELLRNRDFWFISLSVAMLLSADGASLATLTPYALDRGFSLAQASLIMSATTASAIVGKLTIAWIIDRIDLRLIFAVTGAFSVILCGAMLIDLSFLGLLVVASITGTAIGGTFPLSNAMVARRFGVRSLGSARGLMQPLLSALLAVGLYAMGALHDRRGDYHAAFLVLAITAALAAALIYGVRRAAPLAARATASASV